VTGSSVTIAAGALVGTTSTTATASCSAGKVVLGGGGQIASGGTAIGALISSYPSSTTVWSVQGVVLVNGTGALTITPYALCSQ
jgi:hypothetical protein